MIIRALRTTTDMPRGCVAEVDDHTARELIALGYAIEELPVEEQLAAPEVANDNDPFVVRQTGGPTGEAKPLLSLPAAQARPTSTLQQDVVEPSTSPSTTDTNSALGQTPSTPVTATGGKRNRGRPRSGR